ncbi:WXG100 family type VII secretion target [Nonomuraea bangladeshensis]|uniref:WXG100 family type VII secretion target n=1 Tax=Nonomuraea bangladeshensis TaxID=404385 RepID=A0ABV3H3N7_9ACTN
MGGEKKKTHWLKSSCGDWSVETGGRSVEEVVTFIKGFDAKHIAQAATAYKDAHKAVGDVQKALEEQAGQLAKVWNGKASVEAQKALGVLHVTLGELAAKLQKMHEPVEALSTVVRKHQEFIDDDVKGVLGTWVNQGGLLGGTWDDSVAGLFSTYSGVYNGDKANNDFGSQDELAGLHLQTFANDLAHVHAKIPDTVEKVLRDIDYPTGPQITPPPVTYPKGGPYPNGNPDPYGPGTFPTNYDPSGTDPSNRFPTNPNAFDPNAANPNGTNPNGTYPNGNHPSGNGDPNGNNGNNGTGTGNPGSPTFQNPDTSSLGSTSPNGSNPAFNPAAYQDPSANRTTSLQDFTPTNTNGWTPTTGTAHPTTTGNTAYSVPSTSYPPATTASSPGTATGGGFAGANPAVTTAATRATTAGTGMPFLPMGAGGGGGGAQSSEKQESTTWLHEDDDVWGTNPDSVVNSQIG